MRLHPPTMEGGLSSRHGPAPDSTNPNIQKSPLPQSPEWPASKSHRSDPNSTHRRQTSPEAKADPPTGGPPGPAEQQSNDATRSGQTPIAPDSGNHPPGKVDPDPPPSTNRTPRPKPPPKDSENGRYPHRPDRSNTPSPCLTTYREAVTETGQKTRIRKEIREISGRFNSRRRAPAAPLDPGGPMRTPHAAIRCPDRSRPQPGSSLPFDSRSSRHGPPPRPG